MPLGEPKPARGRKVRGHWKSVTQDRYQEQDGFCFACLEPLRNLGEGAHWHPLGKGRDRNRPFTCCSTCGLELNTVENCRVVCLTLQGRKRDWGDGFTGTCHERVDYLWRQSGGCACG